jgi:anti-sigma-K factor RskA
VADTTSPLDDDAFIRAGEHALGVLEGEELSAARRAMLADGDFADAVEWWTYRLGAMAEATSPFAVSAAVWRGIEARIDAIEASDRSAAASLADRRMSRSSVAALFAGAAMAVASLVLFLATPRVSEAPDQSPSSQAGPQLIAQLQDEDASRKLAGVIDMAGNRLALNVSGLEAESGKTPELWVIPAGGAPVSLGAIPESGAFDRALTPEEARLLVAGSTLAVTFEEDTGQRHEAPTMPILLAGTLDQV